MSKRLLGIIIAVVSLSVIGGIVFANRQQSSAPASQATNADTAQTDISKSYTLEEVATHNSEDDCWTVIDGGVYDITSYIPRHPGGDEILRACGTDGSSLFNARKTADGEEVGSGTPHSSSARTMLQRFQVGTLAE